MKKLITIVVVCLIIALAFSIIVTPALAAGKGNGKGNGNGHKGPQTPAATLMVSPNPVVAGNAFEITGTGLTANALVVVGVPGYIPFGQVYTDSAGAFSYTYTRYLQPWTYPVEAYQEKGKSWVLKASGTVTVVVP